MEIAHKPGDLILLRWQYSPNWSTDLIQSLSKCQMPPSPFFAEIHNLILKFIWKCKEPRITKTILKKMGNLIFLFSKLATKLQSSRQCGTDTRIPFGQGNRIYRNKPSNLWSIFDKIVKIIQYRKEYSFLQIVMEQMNIYIQKNQVGFLL